MKRCITAILMIVLLTGTIYCGDKETKAVSLQDAQKLLEAKEYKRALKLYKKLLSANPEDCNTNFEAALCCFYTKNTTAARKYLKTAITVNPQHADSHFLLGSIYYKDNYSIPAIMALSRFLTLAPSDPRAEKTLSLVKDILSGKSMHDGKNLVITVGAPDQTYDGNFFVVDMTLGMIFGTSEVILDPNTSEIKKLEKYFEIFCMSLDKCLGKGMPTGFAWEYYAPYFAKISKKEHIPAFTYYISSSSKDTEVQNWLKENAAKVDQFRKWSEGCEFE